MRGDFNNLIENKKKADKQAQDIINEALNGL